jgi:hypothetical protein
LIQALIVDGPLRRGQLNRRVAHRDLGGKGGGVDCGALLDTGIGGGRMRYRHPAAIAG